MILILDFANYFNKTWLGVEILNYNSFIFPGGEPHLELILKDTPDKYSKVLITLKFVNVLGFYLLELAMDILKRKGFKNIEVFIPYFPGGRQDQVMNDGEAFTLKVNAKIVNSMGFSKVYVLDAHSLVTCALIENCVELPNYLFINKVIKKIEVKPLPIVIVSPDAGASKKVYQLVKNLKLDIPIINCTKHRELKTGQITVVKVNSDESLKGKQVLIIDDICDGGASFLGIAEALIKFDPEMTHLAVSHGLFTKGYDELNKRFDTIFTLDTKLRRWLDGKSVVEITIDDYIVKYLLN